ncbi:MAG: lipocalin family protein [Bacteroidota bacterium]
MKKIKPFVLFILLTCLALPFGCKKNEDSQPDKTVLLAGTTSKKWKLTAATATVGINIDIYNTYLPPCKQDDIFTFSTDNKYETTEGGTSCSPATTDKGTWTFNGDKTQLTLTSMGGAALPYSGVPLTINFVGNTMQGEASNVPISYLGTSLTATTVSFTFTAQ